MPLSTACRRRRLCYAILAGLLPVAAGTALAQGRPAPLSGTVRASTGPALEYATVTLHRLPDSLALKTEFSDAEGRFQLEPAAAGRYLVSVAQVGYGRAWSGPVEAGTAPASPLLLTLTASAATQLQGVTVTSQRPQFERLPDRTIVQVEGSPLSAGNTTLDVLSRAPGVRLDANDNLALRGKQGLLVLLDGKRVPLTGTELAAMLQALPAEQVRSIELITSPPAKYDAQGGAGIISINLRKDQRLGTNGSLNAAYGRGRYGKFTSGLSLNHRTKHLNLFGSYAYADRQNFQELDFRRVYLQDGRPTLSTVQRNDTRSHLQSHTWRAGADVTLTERTTLGAVVSGLDSRLPSRGDNWSRFFDEQGQPLASLLADNRRTLLTPNLGANLTLRHLFPKDSLGAAELTADVDAARYRLTRILNLSVVDLLSSLHDPALLLGDQQGTLTIWSAKTDYVRPLRHGLRLEAGLKASRVESDNDVLFEREEDGRRVVDPGLTNRFRFDEHINAAYLSLTRTRPGLTVTGGLRAEHTRATGRQLVGTQAALDRNYVQLFPSLSVRRPLSSGRHELALTLSRRIDRPTYNQLNPFRSYVDPTSYRTGNPVLWPQTSTQAELTHTFRQKFSTTLSYTRTTRPIVSVYIPDAEGLIAATDVNLRAQEYYGLTLTAPLEPTAWWKLYANAEAFFIRFEGEVAATSPPAGRPGAILSLNNSFTLPHGWSADLNGSYNSPERFAYQDLRSFGQLGLGVQKVLGPATLRLNATDLLYTQPLRVTSRYRVLEERFRSAVDSRVVTASLTYRLGNQKVASARKRPTGAEDEKRRAASGLQ